MSKTSLLLLLSIVFVFSCSQKKTSKQERSIEKSISKIQLSTFVNTMWEFKVADGCISTYNFNPDGESIFYSCELEDKYYGKYYVNNDTLYIHNYITESDSLLPKESEHRSQEARYKLILIDGKLNHIERWIYSKADGLWEKDNFKFDEKYTFERVK
jgi:hypothetical protein